VKILAGGIAPQTIQVIEGAYFRGEEVDDDVAEVHEYPRAVLAALDADGAYIFLFERLPNMFGEGGEVRFRRARSEDNGVGIAGLIADIKEDDVRRFFLQEALGDVLSKA